MKKLYIDYSLATILNNKLGTKKFRKFLRKYDCIISKDKETENFLKQLYTNKKNV